MSSEQADTEKEDVSDETQTEQVVPQPLERNNILLLLIGFRILNALVLKTFFQPDEYYQALEPAWQLAFGGSSGAWITWEWTHRLRSALHPAIFSIIYKAIATCVDIFGPSSSTRSELLLATPKVTQGVIAAFGDYYTWRLATRVYGTGSNSSWLALALSVLSPWQWFCSVRTFSNCLETTLTVIALYNWPFHWALPHEQGATFDGQGLRLRVSDKSDEGHSDEQTRLRRAVIFAVTATILRPTNVLIWMTMAVLTFVRGFSLSMNRMEIICLLREGLTCTSLVLVFSAFVDRIFYGTWTFPPVNFLKFNVLQSLAVFYGNNDWHYYITQGYPLLMMTALPFGIQGLIKATRYSYTAIPISSQSQYILNRLAMICFVLPAALSVLSHKEVRFMYPLLPALHVIAALPMTSFMSLQNHATKSISHRLKQVPQSRLLLLGILLSVNIAIAIYTSFVHNSGLIALPDYLRQELEDFYTTLNSALSKESIVSQNLTFAILMPCHSIPWRSHLQYPSTLNQPGMSGWALTCEPPLDLSEQAKRAYLDEADIFYEDPLAWLRKNMSPRPPSRTPRSGVFARGENKRLWGTLNPRDRPGDVWLHEGEGGHTLHGRRSWPDYLAFFEQLEPTMEIALRGSAYGECARFFNSHWHDDWRRAGDIVVWCLYPERSLSRGKGGYSWYQMLLGKSPKRLTEQEVEQSLHQSDQQAQKVLGERRVRS